MESQSQRHLDPRVRIVWLLPTALVIAAIWLVGSALAFIFGPQQLSAIPLPPLMLPIALLAALLLVLGLPAYVWVHMNYVNFTYELAQNEIVIREGVFTRKRTVIPYGRVQNISTQRTILERSLGLATLNIETAGSNPGVSEGILPGISDYEGAISELLERVERTKKMSGLEGTEEASEGGNGNALQQMLSEARETNRLLREMLKKEGAGQFGLIGGHGPSPFSPRKNSDMHKKKEREE